MLSLTLEQPVLFKDRVQAGHLLGLALKHYAATPAVILGLARGGVVLAQEIAKLLNKPLDVFLVRKLGVPGLEEYGFGAVAEDGTIVLDSDVIHERQLSDYEVQQEITTEENELKRRKISYRGRRKQLSLKDAAVIVVDDGFATASPPKLP